MRPIKKATRGDHFFSRNDIYKVYGRPNRYAKPHQGAQECERRIPLHMRMSFQRQIVNELAESSNPNIAAIGKVAKMFNFGLPSV